MKPGLLTQWFPDSLRGKLLLRVLSIVSILFLLRFSMSVVIDYVYANKAFDRPLLDVGVALAGNVAARAGRPEMEMSEREIAPVLYSETETVYYALFDEQGNLMAGDPYLPFFQPPPGQLHAFFDGERQGSSVRVMTLARDRPLRFYMVIGGTVNAFNDAVREQLLLSAALQITMVVLLGLWLKVSIDRELRPLGRLQDELDQRNPTDLQPVTPIRSPLDLQRLATTINGLFQRIAVTGQAQREFAGNVAHELRTPLAGIRSLADYGLRQTDPVAWRQQLEQIRASEQRASHLVHQLLALAQADETPQSVALRPVDVSALVQDLLLRQIARAEAQGADLGGEGLDHAHYAVVDTSLLEGLLINLVDNALRYGRPVDGSTPQVTVAVEPVGERISISVTDNGPGLAPGELQRVLQRGQRGVAGTVLGIGAGLGLSIAQRYAQVMNASLQFQQGPSGRGLSVRVLLPTRAA